MFLFLIVQIQAVAAAAAYNVKKLHLATQCGTDWLVLLTEMELVLSEVGNSVSYVV